MLTTSILIPLAVHAHDASVFYKVIWYYLPGWIVAERGERVSAFTIRGGQETQASDSNKLVACIGVYDHDEPWKPTSAASSRAKRC